MTDTDAVDVPESGPLAGSSPAAGATSRFAPKTIVRLQYACFLLVGFLLCLALKGALGSAFSGAHIYKMGCDLLPEPLQENCSENTLVYRISFALALFFFFHFVSVSDLTCCIDAETRQELQTRFFCFKTLFLVVLIVVAFCIPNGFWAGYAWLCMFVSALFLVLQVILIVDFSYQWNEDWSNRAENNSKWNIYLALIAFLSYASGIAVTVVSYINFVPHEDCNFNAFSITAVVIAGVVYTMIAVWVPHGSVVPSGIVFCYTSLLCFAALRTSQSEYCNKLHIEPGEESWKMILVGALFSAGALTYSVVSIGGNRKTMTLDDSPGETDPDESGHLTEYCYFHIIMTMGAMYMSMLVTNWNISGGSTEPSTANNIALWVRLISGWGTVLAYLWTLLAPYYCCKDRDFGYDTAGW